jgi:hypothetical protein
MKKKSDVTYTYLMSQFYVTVVQLVTRDLT